jgi:hypothetical protein
MAEWIRYTLLLGYISAENNNAIILVPETAAFTT